MPIPLAISAASSALQMGLGAIQAITGDKKADKLRAQRKAYQTPEEIFKILQATENNAASGYDPETLSFLTNETDRAFNSRLSTARLLGADPNSLGEAFDEKVNQIMKIGGQNHALRLENFNRYLGALNVVAENDAAEQKSRQDMLKDDIQAAVGDKQAGIQNIGNGLNSLIGTAAASATSNIYDDELENERIAKRDYKEMMRNTKGLRTRERVTNLETI